LQQLILRVELGMLRSSLRPWAARLNASVWLEMIMKVGSFARQSKMENAQLAD
jgi:hypothetical protein